MAISQSNSGILAAGTTNFTVSTGVATAATSRVVIAVFGNTIVATPAGFTSRSPQVNVAGHYLFDGPGGSSSWNLTASPAGHMSWHVYEVVNGTYDTSSGQNTTTQANTYTTPTITPGVGERELIASIGGVNSNGTFTMSTWLSSFTEVFDTVSTTTGEFNDHGTATRNITGDGSTTYSTGATYTLIPDSARSAIIASYTTSATAPTRTTVPLTHVASSTWVAPASSATVSPTYPTGVATGDCIYAILHIKPDTATVATPANWALVTAASGGSGTQAAGTGATRVHLYRRVASSAHTGTEAFTITGGSSPVAMMRAYRAFGTNVIFETETTTSWSITTGSTTIGGTAGASLSLAELDEIGCVLGTTDDQSTTLTLTGLTATGATLGTLTQDPAATVINAQGNDISATTYRIAVLAGASSSAPVATATSSSAETAVGFLYRVRATADASIAPKSTCVTQQACVRSYYW